MGTPTGPGRPFPPEGYGPPPEGYGRPNAPGGPPPHLSGPGQPFVPPPGRGGPREQPPYPETFRAVPSDKGFFGALLDFNFDYLVTPKLIKLFYILALLMISSDSLGVVLFGIQIAGLRNGWFLGMVFIVAAPFLWAFQVLLTRIFMESIIVRFKSFEQLRIIKDKL